MESVRDKWGVIYAPVTKEDGILGERVRPATHGAARVLIVGILGSLGSLGVLATRLEEGEHMPQATVCASLCDRSRIRNLIVRRADSAHRKGSKIKR